MKKHLAPIACVLALLPFTASAVDAEQADIAELKVCELLTNQEIAAWYPEDTSRPEGHTQLLRKDSAGSPYPFRASTCFRPGSEAPLRGESFVMIESFPADASMEVVAAWMAKMDALEDGRKGYEDLQTVKVDGATCETGHYVQPQPEDPKAARKPEHTFFYVACDQIEGKHHITVNLQWPDDKAHLPSTAQAKALLDLAKGRLATAVKVADTAK
jgi:hypothetical protein